ncbi:aspartate--ammonia ligase [Paenibacillus lentus]|uniref:Aspartate--ammonia ligase n=1 Tax=Paenibacillus lentus TaxID=1338368 RepID=A0A3Q8S4T8_9BACL|nr:aspartate--ammonia ligase [Paenibacillus lentus]AZK46639.1 aspartate--ammonia ligase [Paenibacillus lentus]
MKFTESPFKTSKQYESKLDIKETQKAIYMLKRFFEQQLAAALNLTNVSAPLFVMTGNGINDNLNGTESPVQFNALGIPGQTLEIVHSLAKWKRMALAYYGFEHGEGLYTQMNAIRADEVLDHLHSIYVDQWDWEKVISREERHMGTLMTTVEQIYEALKATEVFITERYPRLSRKLPEAITFITSHELEDLYPHLTPKQREDVVARDYGAVFVMQIGGLLPTSGLRHDARSPDYDDWQLNGDIIVWNPLRECAYELSSMGIRVDSHALKHQLAEAGCPERESLDFHQQLLANKLPFTIGGGIGQSRLCMFILEKAHIGEVQSSAWPLDMRTICKNSGINLLY